MKSSVVAYGYSFITGSTRNSNEISGISSWALYGSNDKTSWDLLDEHDDVIYYQSNRGRDLHKISPVPTFEFDLTTTNAYRYYRFYIFKTYQQNGNEEIIAGDLWIKSKATESVVPIRYVGSSLPIFNNSPIHDGWWCPNLDFEGMYAISSYQWQADPVNYKYSYPVVDWNTKLEVLNIDTPLDKLTYTVSAELINQGDALSFTFDSIINTSRAILIQDNSLETSITSTTLNYDTSSLSSGIHNFDFYVFKADNFTYMQRLQVTVF